MRQTLAILFAAALLMAEVSVAPLGTYKPNERRHWAFVARTDAAPPAFTTAVDKAWVKTPIDAFILAGLKKNGLKPAPAADRATLIRRVTYDLHGMPPTPEEVDAFVRDTSPKAWEKLIDRLLESPRYGEQWGRHWLDVVRFAESDGYEYDMHRPDGWRYRDYVVQSFNQDKPYNQFVTEQLAGDEINPNDDTYLTAAGFNRLGALRKNAGNQEVASSRVEVLTEMTNIVGAGLLGVTIGCARCHDHKFDPFRQTDYYRMQGYFSQTQFEDVVRASLDEQKAWKEKAAPIQQQITRTQRAMRGAQGDDRIKLENQLDDLNDQLPTPLTALFAVKNDPAKATPIRVLFRGDYLKPGDAVGMRPLGVLLPDDAPEMPLSTEKPRTKLAAWVTDPSNPLTTRVIVNRMWQYHFGRGIVSTANDFGRMGGRPSNPQLLDWLANRFIADGWKMKPLHRMILMSSAYRQSSRSPIEKLAAEKDAENALLWKFNRRRMEAEELRDSMLAVSEQLNPKIGGPSVLVPIEPELVKMLKRPQYWVPTKDKAEYQRRTMYLIYKRNLRLPFMEVFDGPDMQFSCDRREQSTHAPQALEMLNGKTANDLAESFAGRLLKEKGPTNSMVDYAFRLTAGRKPTPKERALAVQYLAAGPQDPKVVKEFALALLNLNAFLYIN